MLPINLLTFFATSTSAFSIPFFSRVNFVRVAGAETLQQPLQDTFDVWIQQEQQVALDKLLANVSPGGRNVEGQGVAPGTVVASPSQDGPDYWYQCKLRNKPGRCVKFNIS